MLVTTTPNIEGSRISNYYGLVSGEAILGANIFKDFFAGIRDIVGGRSAAYEKELRKAKDVAVQEMCQQAQAMSANAVIAVDLDYETIGPGGGSPMVTASGTAGKGEGVAGKCAVERHRAGGGGGAGCGRGEGRAGVRPCADGPAATRGR